MENYNFKLIKVYSNGNIQNIRSFYTLEELHLYCENNCISLFERDKSIKFIDLYMYRIYSYKLKCIIF